MEWNFTNQGVDDLARTLYSCPHALLCYVIDYTTAAEPYASHAFAAGLLLCITIDGGEASLAKRPVLAEHIAKLAALRKTCADRIAHGRFLHTVGLTCRLDKGVVAYGYNSPNGAAVAVAAGEDGGAAQIIIDPSRFQAPVGARDGIIYYLNGETEDANKKDRIEITLPPNDVAVWYL